MPPAPPRQPQPAPLKINTHPTIHRGLFSPPTPDGLSGDGRGPWVRAVADFDELCTYGYPNIWRGHVLLGAGQRRRANHGPGLWGAPAQPVSADKLFMTELFVVQEVHQLL